jgi:hypothetical protein
MTTIVGGQMNKALTPHARIPTASTPSIFNYNPNAFSNYYLTSITSNKYNTIIQDEFIHFHLHQKIHLFSQFNT